MLVSHDTIPGSSSSSSNNSTLAGASVSDDHNNNTKTNDINNNTNNNNNKNTENTDNSKTIVVILAGKVFDPYSLEFAYNQVITGDTTSGLITSVRTLHSLSLDVVNGDDDGGGDSPSPGGGVVNINVHEKGLVESVRVESERVIDLRGQTVLPGFVDAHVHCTHLFLLLPPLLLLLSCMHTRSDFSTSLSW